MILESNEVNVFEDRKVDEMAKNIEYLAKNKSKLIFHNDIEKQVAIFFTYLFKYSNSVCIYDNDLKGDIAYVYERFIPELRDYIESGKSIKIILRERNIPEKKDFYDEIKKYSFLYPDTFKIRLASSDFKSKVIKQFEGNLNFAVGDNNKFRIEKQDDNLKRDAFCSFNNKMISNDLKMLFEQNFSTCLNYF